MRRIVGLLLVAKDKTVILLSGNEALSNNVANVFSGMNFTMIEKVR